jgi:tripartite-type tricarboxylate transporter receptor subunit TctC
MKLPRRQFLHLATAIAALLAVSRRTSAQSYPTRAVRIVVGYPAGGGVDITARLIGQWLSERLGQQFIIENRPGAGSNVATEAVTHAAADGYTLFLVTAANAVNATLYSKLNFDFIRDIAPVAGLSRVPLVMVVNPSLPTKTVPEFIAYAKANPGKINLANGGLGGADHVSGELFKMLTDINMIQVPYRGTSPALADLLGGQVQLMFASMPSAIGYIRDGQIRALAVTTAMRSEAMPELTTVAEFVPGFEASQWYGIGVPRGTPAEIIDKLNKEINAGLSDPKMKARFADLGGMMLSGTPGGFEKLIADETEKWGKVVKYSGVKAD